MGFGFEFGNLVHARVVEEERGVVERHHAWFRV